MKKKKNKEKEYVSETKEYKKIDLKEKDEIETIDEVIKKEKNKQRRKTIKKIKRLIILFILLIACILYARFISTRGLIIKEYAVKTSELNKDYDGLKIVQISDIHYGSTVFKKELKRIVNETNKQNPDIIIFTGDLTEAKVKLTNSEIEFITEEFNKFDASLAYYAIKGNHDYENTYFDTIMAKTKFKVLNNESDLLYANSTTPIRVIGYDDLLKGKPNYKDPLTLPEEMEEIPYTILLIHEPDQIDNVLKVTKDFNIAFAGHSHAGQVRLPFVGAIYTPVGSKKYYDEHYKVENKDLYISNGIGTSTLRLRFLNKPSISLFRFYVE